MDDLNTDLINFSSPVEEDEWKLHIHYNFNSNYRNETDFQAKISNIDKASRTKSVFYFVFLILGVNKNRISEKKQEKIIYI